MDENELIQLYKHRLRVFLIIFFFAEEYSDESHPHYKKIFKDETKIQKIDFWLRNPDYLSFELLKIAKNDPNVKFEIKLIIKEIFDNKEPLIRREEMEKFRFGAYQDLDDVIAYLDSIGLIKFDSKRAINSTIRSKKYFVTDLAIEKVDKQGFSLSFLKWYFDRCHLIKRFFGDKSATQLKDAQYEVEQYSGTPYRETISNILPLV